MTNDTKERMLSKNEQAIVTFTRDHEIHGQEMEFCLEGRVLGVRCPVCHTERVVTFNTDEFAAFVFVQMQNGFDLYRPTMH